MGIGNRIKEARNNLGYTQEELANMLGVTKGAVANYELETSHPKETIMYKLIEVLHVDANYLFQDCVNIPQKLNNVTLAEFEHIKKYRALDDHGKEMVDFTLQKEWERSNTSDVQKYLNAQKRYENAIANKKNLTVDDLVGQIPGENAPTKTLSELADDLLGAAHAIENATKEDKRFDDNIMDDENF